MILSIVGQFIRLRRYENISLHDILQGYQVKYRDALSPRTMLIGKQLKKCDWLALPTSKSEPMSLPDSKKRMELLSEFLLWLFESFVIPVISSHFYVTETGITQNRVFYFRHDVWKELCEPALEKLKLHSFEPVSAEIAQSMLASRKLGCAKIRFQPKHHGLRVIMNLSQRTHTVSINHI